MLNRNLIAQAPIENVNGVPTLRGLEGIFTNLLSAALGLAGILLFLVLLWGGFQYMTAGGNPQTLESAKKTLTYAIAGIIAVALAFMILVFFRFFTGANVTIFRVVN